MKYRGKVMHDFIMNQCLAVHISLAQHVYN